MLADFLDTVLCVQQKTIESDSYGSSIVTYADGPVFMAGIVRNSSAPGAVAEQASTAAEYTLVFPASVTLNIGDRVKSSDGAVYAVTSAMIEPPAVASSLMKHREATVKRVTTP